MCTKLDQLRENAEMPARSGIRGSSIWPDPPSSLEPSVSDEVPRSTRFSGRSRTLRITAFLLVIGLTSLFAEENPPPTCPLPGYRLSWADEFNDPVLNTNRWFYRFSGECVPDNVTLKSGHLQLTMRRGTTETPRYTGGGVICRTTFLHGYYETRARLQNHTGFHPSFWTSGWNGQSPKPEGFETFPRIEIDFFENDGPDDFTLGVHRWFPLPHVKYGHTKVACPRLDESFHTWGCEFTAESLNFYFEGKLVKTIDAGKLPHNPQYVWLSVIPFRPKLIDDQVPPGHPYGIVEYDYFRFFAPVEGR